MFLKTLEEMEKLNTSQIGQSACGPTSVLSVLSSLDYNPIPDPQSLLKFFPARLRDYETKSLSKYLYSRAVAGTIHEEIIDTIEKITNNEIMSKFFIINQYENEKKFAEWLSHCFENKIALVFTENLFLEGNDAWHHQMAYGIKDDKIYLTNPMNLIPVSQMISFLTTGPWMIIPKEHILERDIDKEDFEELKKERWECYGVLNRAMNLKLGRISTFRGHKCYDDLMIPYGGIAGISAFCRKYNENGLNFIKKYTTKEESIYLPIYEKNVKVNRLDLNII